MGIWLASYAGVMADFLDSLEVAVERALREGRRDMTKTLDLPEVCTADDPRSEMCVYVGSGLPLLEHDYRPYTQVRSQGKGRIAIVHVYLRCVHCHVVTCGDADETDPCIEPYHHSGFHRTRLGVVWPKGGARPVQSPVPAP